MKTILDIGVFLVTILIARYPLSQVQTAFEKLKQGAIAGREVIMP